MPRFVELEEAATRLSQAHRVMVFGISGGGKSTLSKKIADRFDLTHVPFDRDVRWLPGWQVRPRDEQRRRIEGFVAGERWVMDGTYISSFDLRLARADLAIWIRPNRVRALWGLTKRVVRNHGHVRSDMADGCPEKLPDREFLHYIWTFERKVSPRITAALALHGPNVPVVQIRSTSLADHLLGKAIRNSAEQK